MKKINDLCHDNYVQYDNSPSVGTIDIDPKGNNDFFDKNKIEEIVNLDNLVLPFSGFGNYIGNTNTNPGGDAMAAREDMATESAENQPVAEEAETASACTTASAKRSSVKSGIKSSMPPESAIGKEQREQSCSSCSSGSGEEESVEGSGSTGKYHM